MIKKLNTILMVMMLGSIGNTQASSWWPWGPKNNPHSSRSSSNTCLYVAMGILVPWSCGKTWQWLSAWKTKRKPKELTTQEMAIALSIFTRENAESATHNDDSVLSYFAQQTKENPTNYEKRISQTYRRTYELEEHIHDSIFTSLKESAEECCALIEKLYGFDLICYVKPNEELLQEVNNIIASSQQTLNLTQFTAKKQQLRRLYLSLQSLIQSIKNHEYLTA